MANNTQQKTIPQSILDHLYSGEFGDTMEEIREKAEVYVPGLISGAVFDLVRKEIKPSEFIHEFSDRLDWDKELTIAIAHEVKERALSPIADELRDWGVNIEEIETPNPTPLEELTIEKMAENAGLDPKEYELSEEEKKEIAREVAEELGVEDEKAGPTPVGQASEPAQPETQKPSAVPTPQAGPDEQEEGFRKQTEQTPHQTSTPQKQSQKSKAPKEVEEIGVKSKKPIAGAPQPPTKNKEQKSEPAPASLDPKPARPDTTEQKPAQPKNETIKPGPMPSAGPADIESVSGNADKGGDQPFVIHEEKEKAEEQKPKRKKKSKKGFSFSVGKFFGSGKKNKDQKKESPKAEVETPGAKPQKDSPQNKQPSNAGQGRPSPDTGQSKKEKAKTVHYSEYRTPLEESGLDGGGGRSKESGGGNGDNGGDDLINLSQIGQGGGKSSPGGTDSEPKNVREQGAGTPQPPQNKNSGGGNLKPNTGGKNKESNKNDDASQGGNTIDLS